MADQFARTEEVKPGKDFDSAKLEKDGIGYCVSGGGYKAAAYHLGGFIRLNETGHLGKIKRIASVSGGSIAAGLLGSRWNALKFSGGVASNFKAEVVEPLKDFLTEVNLDIYSGIGGLLNPFKAPADEVAGGYQDHLVGKKTLQDLPGDTAPRFVLLATNYELNSLWRFSRPYAADHRVGRIDNPTFSLAQIIAASSAFPPFFCPLTLDFKKSVIVKTPGADKGTGMFLKRALLCDGGVYDNMGLEPIWKRYGTLFVSNAGDPMKEADAPTDWALMMRRILSMIHRQAENNRVRTLIALANDKRRTVVYWPLRNDGSNYPVKSKLKPMSASDIQAAQAEDVRLWSLGDKAFKRLVNYGYYLADCALGSYFPATTPNPPAAYPF